MTIKPFYSDGCTIYGYLHKLRWGMPPPFQKTVCVAHDKEYWQGGTFGDKLRADLNMLDGMWTAGYPIAGWSAFVILTLLTPFLPLMPVRSWRWGGGYAWPQWYRERAKEE